MSAPAKLCVLLVAFIPFFTEAKLGPLREVFGWKIIDFEFESHAERQSALNSGRFIPGNSLPINVHPVQDRIFITMPKWKKGIPATLATVPSSPSGDGICDGLTSVFGINVDQCGQLWILDTGVIDILTDDVYTLCPPQLLSFDLRNDRLFRRYIFPNNDLKSGSFLVTVALETVSTTNNCAKTYAYSADITTYGLIVTDTKRGNSWRVENKLFYPYPNWGTFKIAGESFDLMDGVISLAVDLHHNPDKKRLYFHSLAGARESYVRTKLLHNATEANLRTGDFIYTQGEKPSQAAPSAFDSRGILFFGLASKNSLACWNPSKPHIPSNIPDVAQDDVALQFASGVKVSTYYIYQ